MSAVADPLASVVPCDCCGGRWCLRCEKHWAECPCEEAMPEPTNTEGRTMNITTNERELLTAIRVAIIHNPREGWHIHRVGCADIARKRLDDEWQIEVSATDHAAARHAIEVDLNYDLAGDHGMTVEEYLAAGEGESFGSTIRALPCCGGLA